MIYGIQRDEAGEAIGVIRFPSMTDSIARTDAGPSYLTAGARQWASGPSGIFPRCGRRLYALPPGWVEPTARAGELFTISSLAQAVEDAGSEVSV